MLFIKANLKTLIKLKIFHIIQISIVLHLFCFYYVLATLIL